MFSRNSDYEELRDLVSLGLADPDHGFEIDGVAVVSLEGRQRTEVVRSLVHELTHVLNGALLVPHRQPGLPVTLEPVGPWLEEGLASHLGLSHVDTKGRLHPDEISRELILLHGGRQVTGAPVAISALADGMRAGKVGSLEELVVLRRWNFYDGADFFLRYVQGATFIRFLLEDEELAEPFRDFLDEVATGEVDSTDVFEQLPIDVRELEKRYRAWTFLLAKRFDFRVPAN